MQNEIHHLVDLKQFAETGRARWIDGTNQMWIQQYPFASWSHPLYTDTTIGVDEANALKDSFDNKVFNNKYVSDYEHGYDRAKGNKASGTIHELKVVTEPRGIFTQSGLWARVEFNDIAKAEIDNGEWNFWSTSHYDTWTNPITKTTHNMVYEGGTLSNSPYVKGMVPLNFSEFGIDEEEAKDFAVLTASDRKSLPDGAYMYIAPDGTRMFPYKHSDGTLDKVHLQKIVQLAPRANVPDAVKSRVIAKAKRLLGAKSHSDVEMIDAIDIADVEFTENDENNEGGETVVDEENTPTVESQLRELLSVGDDVDIVAHVKGMNDELEPVRNALKQHNERKAFAETFPEEYERLQRLEAESHENQAKRFSEAYVDTRFTHKQGDEDVSTTMGLSALSLDKIREFAKKFTDRTADLDGFKEVIDTVVGAGGTVDYGTKGSARENENALNDDKKEFNEQAAAAGTPQEVRKVFFDKVNEIAEKDELEFNAALEIAAKTYPVLAAAYRGVQPVR